MPGVLTVEALAQTGAVAILSKEENKGKIDVEVEFASPSCYFNSGRS